MIETAYLFQSVLVLSWWIGISLSDSFFRAFQFPGISPDVFSAFLLPDVVVIALLSVCRAYRQSRDLQLVILGGFLYATLFCLSAALLTSGGLFPTIVMILGLCYNLFLCYDRKFFRVSKTALLPNLIKTAIQIVCIWFLTLALFPFLILKALDESLVPAPGPHVWAGVVLFVLSGVIGLWSSYVMVLIGKGTPLPLDQANSLVRHGPYAVIRNPMALAGLGQGIAVSILYLSPAIILYCVLGALAWQFVVRPFEERDLHERFGREYEEYRSRVRCWIPGKPR